MSGKRKFESVDSSEESDEDFLSLLPPEQKAKILNDVELLLSPLPPQPLQSSSIHQNKKTRLNSKKKPPVIKPKPKLLKVENPKKVTMVRDHECGTAGTGTACPPPLPLLKDSLCPLCWKNCGPIRERAVKHIKRCGNNLPTEKLFAVLDLHKKQVKEWEDLGLEHPGYKVIQNKPKPKTRQAKKKQVQAISDDDDLELLDPKTENEDENIKAMEEEIMIQIPVIEIKDKEDFIPIDEPPPPLILPPVAAAPLKESMRVRFGKTKKKKMKVAELTNTRLHKVSSTEKEEILGDRLGKVLENIQSEENCSKVRYRIHDYDVPIGVNERILPLTKKNAGLWRASSTNDYVREKEDEEIDSVKVPRIENNIIEETDCDDKQVAEEDSILEINYDNPTSSHKNLDDDEEEINYDLPVSFNHYQPTYVESPQSSPSFIAETPLKKPKMAPTLNKNSGKINPTQTSTPIIQKYECITVEDDGEDYFSPIVTTKRKILQNSESPSPSYSPPQPIYHSPIPPVQESLLFDDENEDEESPSLYNFPIKSKSLTTMLTESKSKNNYNFDESLPPIYEDYVMKSPSPKIIHKQPKINPIPQPKGKSKKKPKAQVKLPKKNSKQTKETADVPTSRTSPIHSSPESNLNEVAEPNPNWTPMLDYSAIATPVLRNELKRFGIKKLARNKAKRILRHIYTETHKE